VPAPAPELHASCGRCGSPLADDQEWCLECGAAARTRIERAPDWRVPVAIVGAVIVLGLGGIAFALIKLSSDANKSAAAIVASAKQTTSTPATATTTPAPTTPVKRKRTAQARTTAPVPPSVTPSAVPAAPARAATPATTATTAHRTTTTTTTTKSAKSPGTSTNSATPASIQIASWPAGLGGWTVVLASSGDRASAEATAKQLGQSGTPVGVLNSSEHPSMAPGQWVVFSGRYPGRAQAEAAAAQLQANGQTSAHARLVEPPGGN
jgi:septal ring-binding cell division protein DamX